MVYRRVTHGNGRGSDCRLAVALGRYIRELELVVAVLRGPVVVVPIAVVVLVVVAERKGCQQIYHHFAKQYAINGNLVFWQSYMLGRKPFL